MSNYEVDPCLFIYNNAGAKLRIGTNPDAPDCLLLNTPDKEDKDYFGNIQLYMDVDLAKLVAHTILKQIELMKEYTV